MDGDGSSERLARALLEPRASPSESSVRAGHGLRAWSDDDGRLLNKLEASSARDGAYQDSRRATVDSKGARPVRTVPVVVGHLLPGGSWSERSSVDEWRAYCKQLFDGSSETLTVRQAADSSVYFNAPPATACAHAWLVPRQLRVPLLACALFGNSATSTSSSLVRNLYGVWSIAVLLGTSSTLCYNIVEALYISSDRDWSASIGYVGGLFPVATWLTVRRLLTRGPGKVPQAVQVHSRTFPLSANPHLVQSGIECCMAGLCSYSPPWTAVMRASCTGMYGSPSACSESCVP